MTTLCPRLPATVTSVLFLLWLLVGCLTPNVGVDAGVEPTPEPGEPDADPESSVDAGGIIARDAGGDAPSDAGPPPDACTNVGCSQFGVCVVVNGEASCDCDEGYQPVGDLECAAGQIPLDNNVVEDVNGDAIATSADSPFVIQSGIVINGSLVVEADVVLQLEGSLTITGDLTLGAGSSVTCGSGFYMLTVEGHTEIAGTASSTVRFFRTVIAGANNSCHITFNSVEADYAHFSATPPHFGVQSVVRNSRFDPLGNGGDRSFVYATAGTGVDDVVFENNQFVLTGIWGRGLTARNNHFDGSANKTVLKVCNNCIAGDGCSGDRTQDPGVWFHNNVIDLVDPTDTVFSIFRPFGPIDLSGNFFVNAFDPDRFGSWSENSTGCPDDEGVFGGPVVVEPTLASRPNAGIQP